MIIRTFQNTMENIWPLLIIISAIVISTRITYIISHHRKFVLYKELLHLIFIIYILCLFHVVTFQDVNYGGNNFIPFKEMFRYDIGTDGFIKNVLGNIILFIPFGLFISYVLKCKKISIPFILTLIISFTVETVQYYIGRVFDIDDTILNVVGGLTGYFLYTGMDGIHSRLPKFMRSDAFLNFIVIILIIIALIYGFKINILGDILCMI